jgi:hypothetical protein
MSEPQLQRMVELISECEEESSETDSPKKSGVLSEIRNYG